MPQLAYVDGRILPLNEAGVSVEDRGLQFADSLYEVCAVLNGRILDWDGHIERLRRGLAALFLGFYLGMIGIDLQTGQPRLTFGLTELLDGTNVIVVAVGLLAVGETLYVAARRHAGKDEIVPLRGSLYITRPSLMAHIANRENLDEMAEDLFRMVSSGKVRIDISHRYPMSEATEAHRDLEARRTSGSSVLLP